MELYRLKSGGRRLDVCVTTQQDIALALYYSVSSCLFSSDDAALIRRRPKEPLCATIIPRVSHLLIWPFGCYSQLEDRLCI